LTESPIDDIDEYVFWASAMESMAAQQPNTYAQWTCTLDEQGKQGVQGLMMAATERLQKKAAADAEAAAKAAAK
jgi:hypothetical protein